MEQAIENATHQTAQDLHLLLDEAHASGPSADPNTTPLGKENIATPAGGLDRKNNRAATGAVHLGTSVLQGAIAQHCCIQLQGLKQQNVGHVWWISFLENKQNQHHLIYLGCQILTS